MSKKILVIGASGQIGTELTMKLREIYSNEQVIASDIKEGNLELMLTGVFELADATNEEAINKIIEKHQIDEVYLMAAMLSATAEKAPMKAWNLNMNSLFYILNQAKENKINKVFWPSSIAAFGPTTPKINTPQFAVMEPTTVYGISKQTGERWCEYFYNHYGVDVRSLRYPGIVSYKIRPGGGTTDYAAEMFYAAVTKGNYRSYLEKNTSLPMMFMDDAIKAAIDIMNAPADNITVRSSYNVAAVSFTPEILAEEIKKNIENFRISYEPDFRQAIADSWPSSIDDSMARKDWGWKPFFDLHKLANEMLKGVKSR